MLFKVHADLATGEKDFFELNPGAQAIRAFNNCTSRQMFFVCLVADRDYDSPLRSMPERKRRETAVMVAGWPMEEDKRPDKNGRNLILGKVGSVEEAIVEYRKIQFDEEKAILDAVDSQIKYTLGYMSQDKELACTVTIMDKKTGRIKETFVNQAMVGKMMAESIKLGNMLPDLRETKTKLLEKIKITSPINEIVTFTASDLDVPQDQLDDSDESMSTLDKFMAKKANTTDDRSAD